MGWDKGKYYTRSVKVNGRVQREYYGSGIVGKMVAQQDENRRLAKHRQQQAQRDAIAQIDFIVENEAGLHRNIIQLGKEVLYEAGYHCYRSVWRRKRRISNAIAQSHA